MIETAPIEGGIRRAAPAHVGLRIAEGCDLGVVNAVVAYLDWFAAPLPASDGAALLCLICGAPLTGPLGSFTWGIARGEGACGQCGHPARAIHQIRTADGRPILSVSSFVLQYHPSLLCSGYHHSTLWGGPPVVAPSDAPLRPDYPGDAEAAGRPILFELLVADGTMPRARLTAAREWRDAATDAMILAGTVRGWREARPDVADHSTVGVAARAAVRAGDRIRFRKHDVVGAAGTHEATVTEADDASFAVNSGRGLLWFYRDTGRSYTGRAEFVELLGAPSATAGDARPVTEPPRLTFM